MRPLRALQGSVAGRLARPSSGGPTAAERGRSDTAVVALAYDASGTELAGVQLAGVDGYDITAEIVAWGAERVAAGAAGGVGALGPIDAFGTAAVEAGCREAGIARARPDAERSTAA